MSNISATGAEFEGKSVVVTGAGAGMGREITIGFLKQGATVIAVDINKGALDKMREELQEEYSTEVVDRFVPFAGDISKQETNEAMIDRAVEATGNIDVLVNNAGIAGHSEPITDNGSEPERPHVCNKGSSKENVRSVKWRKHSYHSFCGRHKGLPFQRGIQRGKAWTCGTL